MTELEQALPAAAARRVLGATDLEVSAVCVGGSPLGSQPAVYNRETTADQAVETVAAAFESPLNFLDTSNSYSAGESERRIGSAIAAHGGLPDGFILATKVDRDLATNRFDGDRVRDSFRESAERLGINRFQLLYLHDPELAPFEIVTGNGGGLEALVQLKSDGLVNYIGLAGGPVDEMLRYLDFGVFDVLLTHNRFTLLDQSGSRLIDAAVDRGMGVVNAAPYGGGLLAKGNTSGLRYAYGMGGDAHELAAGRMQAACAEFDVPLAAAALQFSLRDERIHSTVVGMSSPSRLEETLKLADLPIPSALWETLKDLVPAEEHWIA